MNHCPGKSRNQARFLFGVFGVALLVIGSLPVSAAGGNPNDDAKKAGHTLGSSLREFGHGMKKVGKEIGHDAKDAGKAVGGAAKEGGKEFKRAIKGER